MNPTKVKRAQVKQLTDLPNVGPACAGDLKLLGISAPSDLRGKDPLEMFQALSKITQQRQDPCVLDVLISIVRFVNGEPAMPWWAYTAERKTRYGSNIHP
jgi:Pathogenicity locus